HATLVPRMAATEASRYVGRGPPELQFQLQFTAVQEGSRGTGQRDWSRLNRSGRLRPELLMRLGRTTGWPLSRDDGGMAEKKCSRCGKVKPLAEFSRAAHGRGGRAAHCKDCHNALYRLPLNRVLTLACLYCGKEFPNPARRGPDRK